MTQKCQMSRMSGYDSVNRHVSSRSRKVNRDGADVTSGGSYWWALMRFVVVATFLGRPVVPRHLHGTTHQLVLLCGVQLSLYMHVTVRSRRSLRPHRLNWYVDLRSSLPRR